MLRLSVTLGLLLAAGACGAPHDGASGVVGTGSHPTGGPISSTMLLRPTMSSPGQPNQARPDSGAVDRRPVRWTQAKAGNGRQLVIYYTAAGVSECAVLGSVNVAETATAVTVTVLVGHLPGTNCGGDQPMLAAPFVTTVTLRNPLGARTVIDGAS